MVVSVNGQPILSRVKLANSFGTRLIGLLDRVSLEGGEGLLLTPCNSVHTMFMRFSLDLVFMDQGKKILRIYEDAKPFRVYPPVKAAVQVLELSAGECRRLGLEEGMVLDWDEQTAFKKFAD
jgi:uncharacterized membrane protein (UPF0127 family)